MFSIVRNTFQNPRRAKARSDSCSQNPLRRVPVLRPLLLKTMYTCSHGRETTSGYLCIRSTMTGSLTSPVLIQAVFLTGRPSRAILLLLLVCRYLYISPSEMLDVDTLALQHTINKYLSSRSLASTVILILLPNDSSHSPTLRASEYGSYKIWTTTPTGVSITLHFSETPAIPSCPSVSLAHQWRSKMA